MVSFSDINCLIWYYISSKKDRNYIKTMSDDINDFYFFLKQVCLPFNEFIIWKAIYKNVLVVLNFKFTLYVSHHY